MVVCSGSGSFQGSSVLIRRQCWGRLLHSRPGARFSRGRHEEPFWHQEPSFEQSRRVKEWSRPRSDHAYHRTTSKWRFHCQATVWSYHWCCQWWLFCWCLYPRATNLWLGRVRFDSCAVCKGGTWCCCLHRFGRSPSQRILEGPLWRSRSHSTWPSSRWTRRSQVSRGKSYRFGTQHCEWVSRRDRAPNSTNRPLQAPVGPGTGETPWVGS